MVRTTEAAERRAPRYVRVSAWAIPVLVLGQFAMLAIVPVALLVYGALRDARVRSVSWSVALVAALYATPLIIWILRDDRARSLSRDMHPAFTALIAAASVILLVQLYARVSSGSAVGERRGGSQRQVDEQLGVRGR